ncbi:hypothetical protein WEI85_17140 [Actinomycetes bacterium KLBMP 9797]
MRRRLLLTVTAALAAVVVALTGGAGTAQANADSLRGPITQAFETLAGGGQPEQVVQRVVAIFEGVRGDILSELDQVVAADARVCARRHVVEFAAVVALSPAAAQAWASDATSCTALIEGLLATATDKATVDKLGLAVNVVGPIAMTARLHVGFANDALRLVLVRAGKAVIRKIEPTCYEGPVYEDDSNVYELWFVCYAYNYSSGSGGRAEAYQLFLLPPGCEPWHGCEATPLGPPVDKERIRLESSRNTSWAVAATVLPLI